MVKVVKFGGSSLANANQFKKVAEIVRSDSARRYVVPSAPGKRFGADIKVTDMLYACYDAIGEGANAEEEFRPIVERFDGIISALNLELDLETEYGTIVRNFKARAGRDYAASRGEYLCGIVLAKFLGFHFIDAARGVKFYPNGEFDADLTEASLQVLLDKHGKAVIPGFYGAKPNGEIKTFSRGGSDVTGSLVAKAVRAALYENWTDVPGVLLADPRIVDNPKVIKTLTYRELRELSYMGATVLHESAIFPVRTAKIPINIRNTNTPTLPGTMIVPQTDDNPTLLTGIAGKKGFAVINLEKDEMNNEIGFLRRILTLFEAEGINFEHIPSGIDTLSVIISGDDYKSRPGLIDRITKVARPDRLSVEHDLALVAIVGRGMRERRGTATRVFASLAHAGVNIKMIDQGSSELNIIVGIKNDDFEKAIRAVYDTFALSE
ncbi:MAG: aspartate kinase [Oscillospiraceae bacterium]|jgi:aspartate kinase|nr:aspartate kinase [Oscillospiraceae bacterium]